MDYLAFIDVETTINGDSFGPHPMHPFNHIVMGGISYYSPQSAPPMQTPFILNGSDYVEAVDRNLDAVVKLGNTITFVGHNLAFDLKYLLKHSGSLAHLTGGDSIMVWDTMVAEYVLNGQDTQLSLTLEATAQRYEIPFTKDPDISKAFSDGVGADKIDRVKLAKYLKQDVEILPEIYVKQMERARAQGQLPLILMRMKARKALIFAEYYGMAFDKNIIVDAMPSMLDELNKLEALLQAPVQIPNGPKITLDLTSPHQLSKWLFGGEHEVSEKVPDGLYKNGKIRWRKETKVLEFPGYITGVVKGSTSEETLRTLIAHTDDVIVEATLEHVLRYRELSKEVSTYCTSLLEAELGGKIHANINCTVTATGRLSSSKPNLQNIKNGKLKAAFVSRYGNEGRLIEIDFAQLEIIALAVLSRDEQLLEDVLKGVDIHTALYEDMYHATPDKAQRKAFKPRTFALVYGASASGISRNAKIPLSEAAKFIKTFYRRYKGVGHWHNTLKSEYTGKSTPVPGKYPMATFQHTNPTGLRLTYYTGDSSTFSPTQLVNYPVQSFAADIVQVMVGVIFEYLRRNFPTALLVNVVHDSLVIDAQAHEAEAVGKAVCQILNNTPLYMQEVLGVDMTPIDRMEVGCTIGKNWADMKEITYE